MLMIGLATTSGSAASFLLNAKDLTTMAIAWIALRESVARRLLIGAAAISPERSSCHGKVKPESFGIGSLAILGTCLQRAWPGELTTT